MSLSSISGSVLGYVAPMTGATSTIAGSGGSVPAPAAGDHNKPLLGSGQWGDITPPNIQIFTADGTYTPTSGMTFIEVEMCGGGGQAGGAKATTTGSTNSSAGGAGGGGGYLKFIATAAQVGTSQAITIGAGGSTSGIGAVGQEGGNTVFGSLATCNGGTGGSSPAAAASFSAASTAAGGSSTLSVGTLINNQTGGSGSESGSWLGTVNVCFSGTGGGTPLGVTLNYTLDLSTGGVATTGATTVPTNYGAGGCGNARGGNVTQTALAGRAGVNGVVIIKEFF